VNLDPINVQRLLVHRRWYDLFLDPPGSDPPRLDLSSGGNDWGARFRLKADFEQSGWRSSMIFDMGVHSYRRGLQEPLGDKRMKAHRAQVLDRLVAAKEINNLERR
jgi:hypothetical protein